MGELALYLYKHGKLILLWAIFLSALALLYDALDQSNAFRYLDSAVNQGLGLLVNLVVLIPQHVSNFNAAVSASVSGSGNSGLVPFIYWIAGIDVLHSLVTFICAQVSVIVSLVTLIGSCAFVLAVAIWTFRKTNRFLKVISDGEFTASFFD